MVYTANWGIIWYHLLREPGNSIDPTPKHTAKKRGGFDPSTRGANMALLLSMTLVFLLIIWIPAFFSRFLTKPAKHSPSKWLEILMISILPLPPPPHNLRTEGCASFPPKQKRWGKATIDNANLRLGKRTATPSPCGATGGGRSPAKIK